MNSISLAKWFNRAVRLPLMVTLGVLSCLAIGFGLSLLFYSNQIRKERVSEIATAASIAMTMGNKILVDASIQAAIDKGIFHSVVICQGDTIVHGIPFGKISCKDSRLSWDETTVAFPLVGLENTFVKASYRLRISAIQIALLGLIFFVSIFAGFRMSLSLKELNQIIVEPIRSGLQGDKFVIQEFNDLSAHLQERQSLQSELVKSHATTQLAQQVAHDIRSPLASLRMLATNMDTLPEGIRIAARSSINRIQDIANSLSQHGKPKAQSSPTQAIAGSGALPTALNSLTLLSAAIETLVSEKRIQFSDRPDLEIQLQTTNDASGLFALVPSTELMRAMSNLINNSAEAMNSRGLITVTLSRQAKTGGKFFSRIEIKDKGPGIPEHILKKLGERGTTYGKEGTESGSGLGVWHAKNIIQSAGGTFEITSRHQPIDPANHGTTITITLPVCDSPDWFCPALDLGNVRQVAVLDDDQNIQDLWESLLSLEQQKSSTLKIEHFKTPGEFTDFADRVGATPETLYLVDFELIGHKVTGLDLIEGIGIQARSILVTSRYEDSSIQSRALAIGLKILPKQLVHSVEIRS